ncbi:hypothetical protein V8C34DRAFT_300256 [Trichoderma compactum]
MAVVTSSINVISRRLRAAVDKRRNGWQISHYTEAPEYIDWPDFPAPPPSDVVFSDGKGNSSVVKTVVLNNSRRGQREKGVAVLNWECPAQIKLGNGDRLFSNGQSVPDTECQKHQKSGSPGRAEKSKR